MVEVANNNRDKAIIMLGYEGGLRIGELATLQYKNIVFTDWGAKIKVHGKTGERVIPIVTAASYLRQWIISHPNYDVKNELNQEDYIFVRITGEGVGQPLSYQVFCKIIKRSAERADINKRVYPHILRHTRATVLANTLTEAQMNHYFGWIQGSDMPATYVHMSGRDIEGAIKQYYGIEEEEAEKKKERQPVNCPRCHELNTPASKFCHKCGLPLREEERIKAQFEESKSMDQVMNEVLSDSELREDFKKKIKWAEIIESDPEKAKAIYEAIENRKNNQSD